MVPAEATRTEDKEQLRIHSSFGPKASLTDLSWLNTPSSYTPNLDRTKEIQMDLPALLGHSGVAHRSNARLITGPIIDR